MVPTSAPLSQSPVRLKVSNSTAHESKAGLTDQEAPHEDYQVNYFINVWSFWDDLE